MSGTTPASRDGATSQEVVRPQDARGAVTERFENPGLVPHRHRMADVDPAAAKRAERQVATLFGISAIGTLLTLVVYFTIKFDNPNMSFFDLLARTRLSTEGLGIGLFLALFGIGAGAVHWAKTLMPDEERVEDRHLLRGSDVDRGDAVGILQEGAAESGLGRRPLIRNSLIGALALVPLPAVVLLRDTGPLPGNSLSTTIWRAGMRLVTDPQGRPVRPADLRVGSVVHIQPEASRRSPTTSRRRPRPRSSCCGSTPTNSTRCRSPAPTRGSSPTRRSAPTWAARWPCTSSRHTICSARATSRPSTSRRTARWSSVRPSGPCHSWRSPWTRTDIW